MGCCLAARNNPRKRAPVISVLTPVDGTRFAPGEPVDVTVSAAASRGLSAIEFDTGGGLAIETRQIEPSQSAATVSFRVPSGVSGRALLVFTAVDGTGIRSDPAMLSLVIGAASAPGPSVTSTSTLPAPPIDSAAPPPCALNAEFVADSSIPDGTQVQAGAGFVKSWRMRNSSLCDWPAGFALGFLDGEQMGGAVNGDILSAVPQGATFDATVSLTAPPAAGVYTSTWRLRDGAGRQFGNKVYVQIRVP